VIGIRIAIGCFLGGLRVRICPDFRLAKIAGAELARRRDEIVAVCGPRRGRIAHLRQRQVFGEAPRRKIFGGARQQREQRSSTRFGPGGAACEIGRHARAIKRFLKVGCIA